jgi:transcriptional regulator with GAF, ATPase, and Fis domain
MSFEHMTLWKRLLSWRKMLLIGAGVLVCIYTGWVLWYVHSFPEIGLRTLFKREVQRVRDGWDVRSVNGQALPDLKDYTIEEIGGFKVLSWPRLMKRLVLLDNSGTAIEVPDLDHAGANAFVRVDDKEFVRIELHKEGKPPVSVWCEFADSPLDTLMPSLLWLVVNVGLFVVAAMLVWRRPSDRSAARFFWLAIVTIGAYVGGYHWSRVATSAPLFVVYMTCSLLLPAVSLHFYLGFPRPKRFFRRHPRRTLLAIYTPALLFWMVLLAGYIYLRLLVRDELPTAVQREMLTQYWLTRITYAYMGLAVILYLLSIASLVQSYVKAHDLRERRQVRWIMIGALVALVPIGYTFYVAMWGRHDLGQATWPMFAASICFTAAFTISLTRYRLLQLDQYMIYFLVSFLFGLVYYALVFLGMLVVGSQFITRPSLEDALRVSSIALILMLILNLGRSRLKVVLDRSFYREKHQLDRTLQQMGQAIQQLVDPPTLARRLLQVCAELLNLSRGAVYLRQGEPPLYRLSASVGLTPALAELAPGCPLVDALQVRGSLTAPVRGLPSPDPARTQLRLLGGEVAYALAHEGRLLALLILGPKVLGTYGQEDLNLLAAFAQMTALALESAEGHQTIETLNRDLQGKVEKISEQQRRILALQSQLQSGVSDQRSEVRDQRSEINGSAAVETDGPTSDLCSLTSGKDIIGSSPAVRQLLQLVRKVSASQSEVLIRGESGTGKELLARALHIHSPRAGQAFVKVHCAALSPGLLESELFGHVKGAFTGAHRDKVGRFELANGGTLFLDEIGDISFDVQTKLLRVLEEMTFERVGSSDPVQVDVRLIAATHQNLEQLIREGRFREDLYYRLNVISIPVPPLRERREDIAELALHFLRLYAQRCGKGVSQMDDDALSLLKAYAWPGNIRQLEHVIERAVVVAEGPTIGVAELPSDVVEAVAEPTTIRMPALGRGLETTPQRGATSRLEESKAAANGRRLDREQRMERERERLVRALAVAGGNKAEAARALGMARSTLLSRLKKHGLS